MSICAITKEQRRHGSQLVYTVAPRSRCQAPSRRHAARMATTSPCAVGSRSARTVLWPSPTTCPAGSTTTAPNGVWPRLTASSASSRARVMNVASWSSRARLASASIRPRGLSPLALGAPGDSVPVVEVLRPAEHRRAPGAGAARQDPLMQPDVEVLARRELPRRVGMTGTVAPLLTGLVAVEEDEVAPIPVVELERAVAEDVRVRRQLLDQLVVHRRERGAVDLAALHAEEAHPDEIAAVTESPRIEEDRTVDAPARLPSLDHEGLRAHRHRL